MLRPVQTLIDLATLSQNNFDWGSLLATAPPTRYGRDRQTHDASLHIPIRKYAVKAYHAPCHACSLQMTALPSRIHSTSKIFFLFARLRGQRAHIGMWDTNKWTSRYQSPTHPPRSRISFAAILTQPPTPISQPVSTTPTRLLTLFLFKSSSPTIQLQCGFCQNTPNSNRSQKAACVAQQADPRYIMRVLLISPPVFVANSLKSLEASAPSLPICHCLPLDSRGFCCEIIARATTPLSVSKRFVNIARPAHCHDDGVNGQIEHLYYLSNSYLADVFYCWLHLHYAPTNVTQNPDFTSQEGSKGNEAQFSRASPRSSITRCVITIVTLPNAQPADNWKRSADKSLEAYRGASDAAITKLPSTHPIVHSDAFEVQARHLFGFF
ncbi:hypothetical protein B0H12DRAFT_1243661 [Mycena haematopus]|nr:hypothetical protein B0H12DRAFT_1243661 [Mycena haematopus]